MNKRQKKRRYFLLLDEGLPPRNRFPKTNNLHNVRHIKHDFQYGGYTDEFIYRFAAQQKRLILTLNVKDFRRLYVPEEKRTGVIAISPYLPLEEIDKKLCKILNATPGTLYGRFIKVTQETGK